ncbi:MAG: hypothetical protein ACREA2_05765, partial [Blastocatellia bacterium]
ERRKTEEERRKTEEERRKTEEERRKTEEERRKTEEKREEERRKAEEKREEERRRIEEELAEERRKTEEERRKTERVIRQQLGELGNKFGSFTEGMAFPSMEKILRNRFKMDVVTLRAKSRQNGHSIEIDVMAYDNGSRNEVYLVEVKSHLTRESVDQMLETIEQFPKFFGAHSHRNIYGIIAAVDIPDNLRAEVLKKGLYLARIHDGEFELLTPKNFKPQAFASPPEQNGGRKAKRTTIRKK